MTNAFILCDFVWKVKKSHVANRECSFDLMYYILEISIAYAWSTLAVASSIIRILLFLRMALARQTNCFCPTLKLLPASDIIASRPPDMHFTILCRRTSLRTFQIWSSSYCENGSKLCRTVPWKRTGSLHWKNKIKLKLCATLRGLFAEPYLLYEINIRHFKW